MTVKERIRTLNLKEKLEVYPAFAESIGVSVVVQDNKKKERKNELHSSRHGMEQSKI